MDKQKLLLMSISQLRALDIKTAEDEALVQEVLNEKLKAEPHIDISRPILRSEETDRITPEKEKELQEKLDGPITVSEPVDVSQETTGTPEPEEVNFCNFCDSKGVRHKKECTRLQDNKENI